MLWIAKYRPRSLDELVEQSHAKSILARFMERDELPHLLLYGPHGVGKRSSAFILGNHWGKDHFLELDGYDLRSSGRNYLLSHPHLSSFIRPELRHESLLSIFRYAIKACASIPPVDAKFKLICISNSQELSFEAQQALRRMLERYSRASRFIFISTSPSKLIPALRSRCLGIHFSRISDSGLRIILERISRSEGIQLKQEVYDSIIYLSKGNAAKSITLLQAISKLPKPSPEAVFQLERKAKPQQLREMVHSALSGDFWRSKQMLLDLLGSGISPEEILEWMYYEILENPKISDELKPELVVKIADLELELAQGLNKYIALQKLLCELA